MKKLIAVLFIFLFFIGCKAGEKGVEEPETTISEPITQQVDQQPQAAAEIEQEAGEPEPAKEQPQVTEISKIPEMPISDLKCVDDRIEAVITNIADETITVAKDVKIIIHGKFIVHPSFIQCEKDSLEPGESMYCPSIVGGQYPLSEKNRFIFRITGATEGLLEVVECPK